MCDEHTENIIDNYHNAVVVHRFGHFATDDNMSVFDIDDFYYK